MTTLYWRLDIADSLIEGGDGLVAARHLFHYGYQPTVYYPKKTSNEIYEVIVRNPLKGAV